MKEWIVNVTWAGWEDDVNSYTYCVKSDVEPDEKYVIDFHNTFVADKEELPEGIINTSPYEYSQIGRAHYVESDGDKEISLDEEGCENVYSLNYSVNELQFYEKNGEATLGDHYYGNGEWIDQYDLPLT